MVELAGRATEKDRLVALLNADTSHLVAVYGRRRVGKTFLIRNVYAKHIRFEIEGIHDGTYEDQLLNFGQCLARYAKSTIPIPPPSSWLEAFNQLAHYIASIKSDRKKVIFFDEFPWFDTPRSRFLSAFANFCNQVISKRSDCIVVLCGSAASYMILKVLHNRGGLHNRVTVRLRLDPFTLNEVEEYFSTRNLAFGQLDILKFYMVLGGVPFYLKQIEKGKSFAQNIDRICFAKDAILAKEFDHLFSSLFNHSENHIAIVRALATVRSGLTRSTIIEKTKLPSGGSLTRILEELIESAFVTRIFPFEADIKQSLYRLSDEFVLFHLKYMDKKRGRRSWTSIAQGQSWISWSGFAFESVCFKHIRQIKQALQILGIDSEISSWTGSNEDQRAQIDLLIDRSDDIVNLCEIKFSNDLYSIKKRYYSDLKTKMQVFSQSTQTRKNIHLILVTTFGLKENKYALEIVQQEIRLEQLFLS